MQQHPLAPTDSVPTFLPKLADAGLVEYDIETQTVQYWAHGPLELWLDRIPEEGR